MTRNEFHLSLGRRRAAAARKARSTGRSLGRRTCRRRTLSWCRSTAFSISSTCPRLEHGITPKRLRNNRWIRDMTTGRGCYRTELVRWRIGVPAPFTMPSGGNSDCTGTQRTTSANAPSGSSRQLGLIPQVPPHTAGANLGHHERELHDCHFPPTMFTKQVSPPADGLDPPIVAAEVEQVERTRRRTWSRARSEVSVPFTPHARRSSGRRTRIGRRP